MKQTKQDKKQVWKPKRYCIEYIIDTKGKSKCVKYIQAKTQEEEQKMEEEIKEQYADTIEAIWGENCDLIAKSFYELSEKLGEDFKKEYDKAYKQLKEEWGDKEIPITALHILIARNMYKNNKGLK